jgi:hypothetical protein
MTGLLVVPCFWHDWLMAGDLGSHAYNAWLAHLIRREEAPGLFLVTQQSNVLFDYMLSAFAAAAGFGLADKLAAAVSVVVLFWGAFMLIESLSGAPWRLSPLLAMLSYGWTFNAGFFNYYLSIGFGSLAVAALSRPTVSWRVLGTISLILCYMSHPLGLAWAAAIGLCSLVWSRREHVSEYLWPMLAVALIAIIAVIARRFAAQYEVGDWFNHFGPDQLKFYTRAQSHVSNAVLLLSAGIILFRLRDEALSPVHRSGLARTLIPYLLAVLAAEVVPNTIEFSDTVLPLSLVKARITLPCAILLVGVVNYRPINRLLTGTFGLLAIVYFGSLYTVTGVLSGYEGQMHYALRALPKGARVVAAPMGNSFFTSIQLAHAVDRSCLQRCFSWANYEPPTHQFRVRARPGSTVQTNSPLVTSQVARHVFRPRPFDPPLWEVYRDSTDTSRIRVRALSHDVVKPE